MVVLKGFRCFERKSMSSKEYTFKDILLTSLLARPSLVITLVANSKKALLFWSWVEAAKHCRRQPLNSSSPKWKLNLFHRFLVFHTKRCESAADHLEWIFLLLIERLDEVGLVVLSGARWMALSCKFKPLDMWYVFDGPRCFQKPARWPHQNWVMMLVNVCL